MGHRCIVGVWNQLASTSILSIAPFWRKGDSHTPTYTSQLPSTNLMHDTRFVNTFYGLNDKQFSKLYCRNKNPVLRPVFYFILVILKTMNR